VQIEGPEATEHRLVVMGLRPARTYATTVRLDGPSGVAEQAGPEVSSGALPADFPAIEVLAWEPDQVEPGFTLVTLSMPQPGEDFNLAYHTVFDPEMQPVWVLRTATTAGYSRWEDGLWMMAAGYVSHYATDGLLDLRLLPAASSEEPLPVDVPMLLDMPLHYDILPAHDDSFYTVAYDTFTAPAYPLSLDELEPVEGDHDLRDMVIARLGFDGTVRELWPLSERLDTTRVGYGSFNPSNQGYDWAHTNAVNHDPDGGVIVSSRHQDAVFHLDEQGDLTWILSNPDGWSPEFQALRLQPKGEVSWPYHQHAPHVSNDGTLMMFDNGNQRHSPYDVPDVIPEPVSRVVGYRVDAEAMTVEELWSFEDTVTGPLFCSALGDADPQPLTGNVLATFGTVQGEGGVPNEEQGRGSRTVRLIEFVPDTLHTVLDVRFSTPHDTLPDGVRAFRAERIPLDAIPWVVRDGR